MNDIKISLDATGAQNEITLVRVDGVIDTMTATELEKVINSLLEQTRYYIIIDLAGVDYISSAGWGIFISNIREIRQQGGDIKLARMIPNVYEIFELLEFDSILKAFENIEDAKSDFKYTGEQSSSPILEKPKSAVSENNPSAEVKDTTLTETAPPLKTLESTEPKIKGTFKPISKMTLDEKIVHVIKGDPFLSISSIKQELQSGSYSEKSVGWWGVFKWLYSHSLATRKSRYRYTRGLK
ncbi:MAG: STAS domain-containing protein [candidate division Zixibacteria bacterium]|nr:STAS domain-containing protein [candidate division Zixibacteria bacterium]